MKKIVNRILHRLKEDSLTRNSELTVRELEYKSLDRIRTGLIFWVADGNQEVWLKKLSTRLKGVKLRKLCYVPADVKVDESLTVVTMRNEDLGFGGKIQNSGLDELLEGTYDVVIDLSGLSNGLINHVLSNMQASCVIGMKKEGSVADIVIDEVTDPAEFIDRLIELLEKIKSC